LPIHPGHRRFSTRAATVATSSRDGARPIEARVLRIILQRLVGPARALERVREQADDLALQERAALPNDHRS
jgi:hypothetical protein